MKILLQVMAMTYVCFASLDITHSDAAAQKVVKKQQVPLTGSHWALVQIAYNDDKIVTPAKGEKMTLAFGKAGQVNGRAGINRFAGRCTVNKDRSLKFSGLALTRAANPPGSIADTYIKELNNSTRYLFDKGMLILELPYDTGVMKFRRQNAGAASSGSSGAIRFTQLNYETGGVGEYTVNDGGGTRTISKLRLQLKPDGSAQITVDLDGDGFILNGRWKRQAGRLVKVTLTHGFDNAALKGSANVVLRNAREFEKMDFAFDYLRQKTRHTLKFTAAKG